MSGYGDDKRRDTYVALREWQRHTGRTPSSKEISYPEKVLRWASEHPEVRHVLRHQHY